MASPMTPGPRPHPTAGGPARLYGSPDLKLAYCAWAANCGPAAFAASIRRPLMNVGKLFPQFPARPWTNPTHMRSALDAAGVRHLFRSGWPAYGLAFVRLEGPWEAPGVPVAAAYRRTHWVGVALGQVYDINADGWLPRNDWEYAIVPQLLAHTYRSTGWRVRTALEVWPPAIPRGTAVPAVPA